MFGYCNLIFLASFVNPLRIEFCIMQAFVDVVIGLSIL